jgi:hypothetical protein
MKKFGYRFIFALSITLVFCAFKIELVKAASIEISQEILNPQQGIIIAVTPSMMRDTFLYQAAMSKQFSNVYSFLAVAGKHQATDIIRRYVRLDGFKKCMEGLSSDRLGRADMDRRSANRLHQPHAYNFHLISGKCVEASLQDSFEARYKITNDNGFIVVEDLVSGTHHKTPIRSLSDKRIWGLFGLAPLNISSAVNRVDPQQVDSLTNEEVERALNENNMIQAATLEIIGDRLQIEKNAGFQVKVAQMRATDLSLANILIEKGVFRSSYRRVRQHALRAAATMPAMQDKLLPEIIAAVTLPIIPKALSDQDQEQKVRIEKNPRGRDEILRLNRHLFESKSLAPGYDFPEILSAAGLAVSQFGQEATDVLIREIPSKIFQYIGFSAPNIRYDQATLTTFDNTGLFLMLATSGSASERASQILSEQHGRANLDRTGIEIFLETMPELPELLKKDVVQICKHPIYKTKVEKCSSLLEGFFCLILVNKGLKNSELRPLTTT